MGRETKASDRTRRGQKRKKAARSLSPFTVWGLLILLALAAFWYFWNGDFLTAPRFNFCVIKVNGEPRKFLPGESVRLHPNDRVEILEISTNIPFNYGVRLWTEDMDVGALRHGEMPLAELLPGPDSLKPYNATVRIRYRNQELGGLQWMIRPYAEDWLEKADRIIDDKKRLALLKRARQALPDDRRVEQRLVDTYAGLGRWKSVADLLERRVEKKPDPETLLELLRVYETMKDTEGHVSTLERLIRLDPEDLKARMQLAELLEQQGKKRAALTAYEALLKRIEGKGRLPVYKRLGYLYTEAGQYKKAVDAYQRALELDRSDANLYYNLSFLHDKAGHPQRADDYLEKAVSLKPKDLDGHLKLAQRRFDRGELEAAEGHAKDVLERRPDSLEALSILAQIYEKREERDALLEVFKRMHTLDPKNDTLVYNLAVLEYEAGRLNESLPYFKRYLEAHPHDAAAHEILFDLYRKQNDRKGAQKEAEILLALKSDDLEPYYYLFETLKAEGKYDEIIALMEPANRTHPEETVLKEYLVFAYLESGRLEKAARGMEGILAARPDDAQLWLDLARLREKLDMFEGALAAYKRVIELSPGNEEAEEAYLRLRLRGVGLEGGE